MQRKVITQCWLGVGEQCNKNGRNEWSDLWDPTSVMVAHQPKCAPGTHIKFSASCTIKKVWCLEHLKVLCPWHHKSSLHSMFSSSVTVTLCLVSRLLGQGWKGPHSLQGWLPLERTGPGPQCHHQHPPILVRQSLWALSMVFCAHVMVQCTAGSSSATLWWCSTLLELACWPPCKSHKVAAVLSQKEITFCMTLQSATCQPTCCLLMKLCFGHQP